MAYISQLNGPLAWAYCLGVVSLFIIGLLAAERILIWFNRHTRGSKHSRTRMPYQ